MHGLLVDGKEYADVRALCENDSQVSNLIKLRPIAKFSTPTDHSLREKMSRRLQLHRLEPSVRRITGDQCFSIIPSHSFPITPRETLYAPKRGPGPREGEPL